MTQPKRIDIKEFRKIGYLQEVNRQFLHPLGLALEVIIDNETGEEKLGGVWDYRDDPEGMLFDRSVISEKDTREKKERIVKLWGEKDKTRWKKLRFMIQPIPMVKENEKNSI